MGLKRIVAFTSIVLLAILQVSSKSYTLIADINFESATVNDLWDLYQDGNYYPINKHKGQYKHFTGKPAISSYTKTGKGTSLKLQVNATTDTSKKSQRTEYVIKDDVGFDSWRYVGFQLALHSGSQPPEGWNVLTQFHQLPQPLISSPMAALELSGEGRYMLGFIVRNSEYHYVNGERGSLGNRLKLWSKDISEGRWYDIVLGVCPNGSETGQEGGAKVWMNGDLELEWTGNIGFPSNFLGETWPKQYHLKSGIYRKTQNTTLRIHYDNYKFGTSYEEVAP